VPDSGSPWQQYVVAFKDPYDVRVIRTHPVWADGRRKAQRCGRLLLVLAYQ